MNPFDYVEDINFGKKDLIRKSDSPDTAEKLYEPYITQRAMSMSMDTLLYANELNIRGNKTFNLGNRQHYEYLLHSVGKKRRFEKWPKMPAEDNVTLIKSVNNCSRQKALEILDLLTEEQLKQLKASRNVGGVKK